MPQKYIKIPDDVVLKDPTTKKIIEDGDKKPQTISFKEFIQKLMFNPMWNENYPNIKAAKAIDEALEGAKDGYMVLAEEDWKKLDQACQNPKQMIIGPMGPSTQPGYGYHPTMVTQLLPLIEAVVKAEDKDPRLDANGKALTSVPAESEKRPEA